MMFCNITYAETVLQGGTGSSGVGNIVLTNGTVTDVGNGAYFNSTTSPASDWVWDSANSTGSSNPLVFTFTFSLSGYDISTASLSGLWGVDNVGSVSLNGTQISELPNLVRGNFNQLHNISVAQGSNLFVQGENVLTFNVNDLGLPGGFRTSVEVTADPSNTPIFSSSDGILGGQLNGSSFEIGQAGSISGGNNWPSNEGPEHLIDGVGQKYLNFGEVDTGAIITPTVGCSVANSITFWTANDFSSRDPASYKLYGTNNTINNSNNPLALFTLIAEGSLALPSSRNADGNSPLADSNAQTITFANDQSYASYLLLFPSVKNSSGANSMQIGEAQLFGSTTPCQLDLTPIAEYRFDELSWDGSANAVVDNSGNNNNGTAIGGINTLDGKICHAADIPSNTSRTTYEAVDTRLDLDADIGSTGSISLWYQGNEAWNANSDKRLFDATDGNKYFFAEIRSDGRVKFWLEDSNDGDYQKVTSNAFNVSQGVWKHLVFSWDISNQTVKVFIDGIEQTLTGGDGGTSGFSGFDSLYFGDNRDASYITGQSSADGLIDEALVFNSVLTASQVTSIYNNQNAGKNYDGTERTCPPELSPLLEYRFEEESWNGTDGEILDSSGNNHHASVHNNSQPETSFPALSGDPGTCGYASQNDGSIQVTNLPLDTTTVGVKTTVTFWMNWDGTNNVMPMGWNFHDIWMVGNSMGFNTWRNDIYGISSAGLANGWHHVAVEFTNGSVIDNRMHIDGVEQVLTNRRNRNPNNSRAFVNSQMRVGGVTNSSFYDFHGSLDEFRVYEGALTTEQIQTIMAERHDCSSPALHHYEIEHDGEGLTCEAENVTIKACENESCSILSTESVTLDFLADGNLINSPTFVGSTLISFNNTDVETLTLSVANATVAASNSVVCDTGSNASCDIAFADSGFRFLSGNNNATTLPNQIAGVAFPETLKIQAVKDNNGVCTPLFTNNKVINLSQENVNPSGIGGLKFTSNGDTIGKHPTTTPTTLNFGADSIATITAPIYHDAGSIRLRATFQENGISLTGASNAFWVRPDKLVISADAGGTVLNGQSNSSTTTHKAGESFNLTVTAYNGATPMKITRNYAPGQIELMLDRTGPTLTGSSDGELTYAAGETLTTDTNPIFAPVTLASFSSGVSEFNGAHYSEVGLINLDIQDKSYGDGNINVPGDAIDIGRFTPHHFKQTVAQHGSFLTTCNAAPSFAYSGQKNAANEGTITYLTNPVIAITAYNKQDKVTENYYENNEGSPNDYMMLSTEYNSSNREGINIEEPTFDEAAVGVDGNLLPITASLSTGALKNTDLTSLLNDPLPRGTLHYELSDADHFFYNRSANSKVTPFISDIDFTVTSIRDSDGVTLNSTEDISPTGVNIRFGRQVLENSYGPETANLPQPMRIEHFDGASFITSSNANCVSYDKSNITLTNISLNPALTDIQGDPGNFVDGETQQLYLEAPGAENQGSLDVLYNTFDWLEYDWKNDGNYTDPSATATFGVFRGNDRIIYWREINNE